VNPPLKLLTTFKQVYPGDDGPKWVLDVPGRELWLAAQPITRQKVTLVLPDLDARLMLNLSAARRNRTLTGHRIPHHLRYVPAMLRLLAHDGKGLPGLLVVIAGTEVPGPRYEHALGMALATLGCDLNACAYDDASLLALVERVEKEYF
jgi:hypothetical protein